MRQYLVFVVLTTILVLSSSTKVDKRSLVPLFTSNPLFRKFFSHQYDYDTHSQGYSQDYDEQQNYFQSNVQPDVRNVYGNSYGYENQDNDGSFEFGNQENEDCDVGNHEYQKPEYGGDEFRNQEYGTQSKVHSDNTPTSTTDEYRPKNKPSVSSAPVTEEMNQNENVGVKFNSLPWYDRSNVYESKPKFVESTFNEQNQEDAGPIFNSLPWYERPQQFNPHQDKIVEELQILKGIGPEPNFDSKSFKLGNEPDWFLELVERLRPSGKFSDQQWNTQVLPYLKLQLASMQLSPFYKIPNFGPPNLHLNSGQFYPSGYLGNLQIHPVAQATQISPFPPGSSPNQNHQLPEFIRDSLVNDQSSNSQNQAALDQQWNSQISPYLNQQLAFTEFSPFYKRPQWDISKAHQNVEQFRPSPYIGDTEIPSNELPSEANTQILLPYIGTSPPSGQQLELSESSPLFGKHLDTQNKTAWRPVSFHHNLKQFHPTKLDGDSTVHLTGQKIEHMEQFRPSQYIGDFEIPFNGPIPEMNPQIWSPYIEISPQSSQQLELSGFSPSYQKHLSDTQDVTAWSPVRVQQNLEQFHPTKLDGDSTVHLTRQKIEHMEQFRPSQYIGDFEIPFNGPIPEMNPQIWSPYIEISPQSSQQLELSGFSPSYQKHLSDTQNVTAWSPVRVQQNLEQFHPTKLDGDSTVHLTGQKIKPIVDSTGVSESFNLLPHYDHKLDFHHSLNLGVQNLNSPRPSLKSTEEPRIVYFVRPAQNVSVENLNKPDSGNLNFSELSPFLEEHSDTQNVTAWSPVSIHHNLEQLHPTKLDGDSRVHMTGQKIKPIVDSTQVSGGFNLLPHYDQKVDFHHPLNLGVQNLDSPKHGFRSTEKPRIVYFVRPTQNVAQENLNKPDSRNEEIAEILSTTEQFQKFELENSTGQTNVSSKVSNVGPVLFLSRNALTDEASTNATEPNFSTKTASHVEHPVANTTLEDFGVEYMTSPRILENSRSEIASSPENFVSSSTPKILETTKSVPFVPRKDKTGLPSVNRNVIFNPGFTSSEVSRFDQDPELEEFVDDYFEHFGDRLQPRNKTTTVAHLPLDHNRTSGFQFVLADSYGKAAEESYKPEWNKRSSS